MRSGLIAKKNGYDPGLAKNGTHVPVTVLHVDCAQVVAHKTTETDGYNALYNWVLVTLR